MKAIVPGLAAMLLGACASHPQSVSDTYWRSTSASGRAEFATANASCSARATRVVPQPRADLLPGGATIVDNRIDRPPKRWVSAAAERAYMDCMAQEGWLPVPR